MFFRTIRLKFEIWWSLKYAGWVGERRTRSDGPKAEQNVSKHFYSNECGHDFIFLQRSYTVTNASSPPKSSYALLTFFVRQGFEVISKAARERWGVAPLLTHRMRPSAGAPPPRENTLMFTFPCNDITEHLCGVPAEKTLWSLTCCISKLSNPPKLYHVRAGQGWKFMITQRLEVRWCQNPPGLDARFFDLRTVVLSLISKCLG